MLDTSAGETPDAHDCARRLAERRQSVVMSALEGALRELEALRLAGLARVPTAERTRIAALIGEVLGLDATPRVPGSVSKLMETVRGVRDAALARHLHVGPSLGHGAWARPCD
ncbi:MAG TPA: hypothetical protein VKF59_05670 [Candidatus Dormibacteraeota bacterium]|nr:hypothetical protein [Candidatus Dormibacteraeota bacterium]